MCFKRPNRVAQSFLRTSYHGAKLIFVISSSKLRRDRHMGNAVCTLGLIFGTLIWPAAVESAKFQTGEFKCADAPPAATVFQAPQRPAPTGVYKAQVTPHWFQNNARFWYRNDLKDGIKEFIVVDAERGQRALAFDHAK